MFQTIILLSIVVVAIVLCGLPSIKEWQLKNTLKSEELFCSLEEDLSYEEVCEIIGCECEEKTEVRVGFKRKQDRCIWTYDPIKDRVFKLVVNFEDDMLVSKDIVSE